MDPDCESLWKKMIGKPYSGKLNVRFDEGELEIEPRLLRQFPTLPPLVGEGREETYAEKALNRADVETTQGIIRLCLLQIHERFFHRVLFSDRNGEARCNESKPAKG